MDGNSFLPFFLHDVVLPEEMLEPTSVPFSFDHGLPLNNNTEQTRSLPHRDKKHPHLCLTRLPPVPATFCAATQNKRLQPRAEFRARTHQITTPPHHVVTQNLQLSFTHMKSFAKVLRSTTRLIAPHPQPPHTYPKSRLTNS